MSIGTLQKKGLKIVFASLIASMLVVMLAVTSAGSAHGQNPSEMRGITYPPPKLDDALLQKLRVVGFPSLGALAAAATLLLPFGLSTLRIWRKDRSL